MSKTLNKIFEEAELDSNTTQMSGNGYKAFMKLGIKITKDLETNKIKIFDHSSGGNYYVEMNDISRHVILNNGWVMGVTKLTLDKYKFKLDKIKEYISLELNGNQSKKRLSFLKDSRQQILHKYYKLTQKLNKKNV